MRTGIVKYRLFLMESGPSGGFFGHELHELARMHFFATNYRLLLHSGDQRALISKDIFKPGRYVSNRWRLLESFKAFQKFGSTQGFLATWRESPA